MGAQTTPLIAAKLPATPATVKPVGPDFCLVQLTAAGVTAAGEGSLRYSNGRQQFVFQPGEPIKVARYEWDLALAGHTTANGQPLFEIVPNPVANPVVAPAANSSAPQEEKK